VPGYQRLLIGLRNTGNVLVKPLLFVRLTSSSDRLVFSRRIQLDTFVPNTEIVYPAYIRGKGLRPGQYRATVTVRYPPGRVVSFRGRLVVGAGR
jgi:hypothetical protein